MSEASPKPLRRRLAPSAAKARAIARPIPVVEPVTTAVLDFRIISRASWYNDDRWSECQRRKAESDFRPQGCRRQKNCGGRTFGSVIAQAPCWIWGAAVVEIAKY